MHDGRFSEIVNACKGIYPDILWRSLEKQKDGGIFMLVKKKNIWSEIDLEYQASGIDQLFIII